MFRSAPAGLSLSRSLSSRVALVALVAGALGGCNIATVTEPIFTGSTPNQKAIISGRAAQYPAQQAADAPAAPSGSVARQDLPSSGAASPGTRSASPGQGTQVAARSQTPQSYAARGMPQPLGPLASKPMAPQQPAAAASSDANASGGAYVVKPGDSLWSIAQAHNVTTSDLLAANGLKSASIAPGQTLAIPASAGGKPRQVASLNAGAAETMADVPASLPEGRPDQATAPQRQSGGQRQSSEQGGPPAYTPPASTETAALPKNQEANAAGGFRWPVRGRIIASFGDKPNGERNDGIKLAVPEGTSVKAAEDGTVIYSGDELKSYGNLILIRHADGWVSAYAHNKELMVRRGDEVRRGQIIARSGMTGNVTTPQIHFELRKGATPVDPLPHMSEA